MRLMRRPFKGHSFYEWQVLFLVIQVRHASAVLTHAPRVNVWRDRFWRA